MQTATQATNWQKQWGMVVAKTWCDEEFKQRLMADPAAVLDEHGIEAPPGVELRILEDSDEVRHLVLPPSPAGELTDEELSCSIGLDSFSGLCGRCGRCGCGSRGCDGYER